MKRKYNVFVFSDFIKLIESGLNVSESCNELNYNRSRMYDTMTDEQKTELRVKRSIKYRRYFRDRKEVERELSMPYKQNEKFNDWLNGISKTLENTPRNVITLDYLRLKYTICDSVINIHSQIKKAKYGKTSRKRPKDSVKNRG